VDTAQIVEFAAILMYENQELWRAERVVRFDVSEGMGAWSLKQHSTSGLLRECAHAPLSIGEVDDYMYTGIRQAMDMHFRRVKYKNSRWSIVPVGFCIADFDKPLVRRHMPRVYSLLSYHSIDLRTLRSVFDKHEAAKRFLASRRITSTCVHRAMKDCEDSVHFFQHVHALLHHVTGT